MRLPFGLGRRSSSGDEASSGSVGTSASGGSASAGASGSSSAAAAAPSRAWASLPPIQRTAGSMPQVAAPARFAAALPGSRGLPPIVQPLGHEVSSLATPGLVVARVRPVEAHGSGSIPAPVQRRAARGSRQAPAAQAPIAAPEVIEHAAEHAPSAAGPASAPIRSMPTLSRSAVRVPDRPLTSAASAARPAAVQRAAAAAATPAGPTSAPALPAPSGGMRRAPSSVQRSEAPGATPATVSVSRSGLGEPMTSLPASARPISAPGPVIARSAAVGARPIAASGLRSPVQRSTGVGSKPGSPLLVPSGAPAALSAAPSTLPELPLLPVARVPATSAAPAPTTPAPAPTAPAARGPEIRPTAGANPIRTALALQRDAADDLDDDGDGDDDDAALPTPWWGAADVPGRSGSSGAPSADGPPASIQRSIAGPDSSGGRSPFASPDLAAAAESSPRSNRAPVQRVAGPAPRPSLPALTLPHAPGARAAAASAVTEAPAPAPSIPTRSIVSDAVVQTSRAGGPATGTGTSGPGQGTVQREENSVAVAGTTPVPPAGPVGVAGQATGGAGPAGPSSGRSEKDLDELAQALFGRIRGRLRSDLIYDREAKGLTFDNV